MPLMHYKAMDERGKISTGRVEAANSADLEMRLSRLGLDLINFKEMKASAGQGIAAKRVARREMIGFCFQLEQLLSGGVAMLDALIDLRDSVDDKNMREVVASMVESIQGGQPLSEAMSDHPGVFDSVFVNLVKAGELSGQIGPVLRSITENLKWHDELVVQMRKLMMYPLFVGSVVLMVLIFLMTYLVPQLVSFISNMQQELPLHTRLLIQTSDFFIQWWYIIILIPAVVFFVVLAVVNASPRMSYMVDDLKLRLWLIGPILKKIILARFANYFALMYASGITVLECVRISESLVGNKAIEEATRRAGRQIADGASISAGFEYTGLFPPLVVRMLRVGENTGALDTALRNISYFYDRDVRESMDRLQTLIGPAMTVVLGGLLFWVIVSVLGPIYDLISTIEF